LRCGSIGVRRGPGTSGETGIGRGCWKGSPRKEPRRWIGRRWMWGLRRECCRHRLGSAPWWRETRRKANFRPKPPPDPHPPPAKPANLGQIRAESPSQPPRATPSHTGPGRDLPNTPPPHPPQAKRPPDERCMHKRCTHVLTIPKFLSYYVDKRILLIMASSAKDHRTDGDARDQMDSFLEEKPIYKTFFADNLEKSCRDVQG
jgi:hypothetical protein